MGVLFTLLVIFMIVLALTLLLPPDQMSDKEVFKAKVSQIWCAVNICRTAGLGEPLLQIRSTKGFDLLKVDFPDKDTVIVSLPFIQIEQRDMKTNYLEIFAERGFDVTESIYAEDYPVLNISLDRKTENLGQLITSLYQKLFHARIGDKVSLTVWTLKSDMAPLRNLLTHKMKPNEDAKFVATSARFNGKHAPRIQMDRIIQAANILLYPLVIILSYKGFGLIGLGWAGLAFFGFFFIYRTFYQKKPILSSSVWRNMLYCGVFISTLVTQQTQTLQLAPSILASLGAFIYTLFALNILEPQLKDEIQTKRINAKKYKLMTYFQIFAGLLLCCANEWARRVLNFDQWIWFFGLLRIELTLAALIIVLPILFVFLKIQNNTERDLESKSE